MSSRFDDADASARLRLRSPTVLMRVTVGAIGGYALLHPVSMVLVSMFSPDHHPTWHGVSSAFTLSHLPMGAFFAILGALLGFVHHRGVERLVREVREQERLRLERERILVLLETAGAVCHELGQPVSILRLQVQLLEQHMPPSSRAVDDVRAIVVNLDRMGGLLHRLQRVTRYVTKPYVGNMNIIDIEKACELEAGD